jgi:hypothetical protein
MTTTYQDIKCSAMGTSWGTHKNLEGNMRTWWKPLGTDDRGFGNHLELDGNLFRTWWNILATQKLTSPPNGKKNWGSWVHATSSDWQHFLFVSKFVHHHFVDRFFLFTRTFGIGYGTNS